MNTCKTCKKDISTKNKLNKFCSSSCAASYNNKIRHISDSQKIKTSNSLKHYYEGKHFKETRTCIICNNHFTINYKQKGKKTCSFKCAHTATGQNRGKKSASKRILRSKDETQLFDLIRDQYPDATHNTIISDGWDADICIPSLNILIFWNGPWHYKEMHCYNHSLIQVQTRDKIKKQLFESLGWVVLVFEDRFFTPETAFKQLVDGSGLKPDNTTCYEQVASVTSAFRP